MPVHKGMRTVVETRQFIRDAEANGLDEVWRLSVVDTVANDPEHGDLLTETGGYRKFRAARPGGGKSGGFRVLSLYPGEGYPVYLILVFGKNEKANVSAKEKKALKKAVDELIAAHEPKRKAVEK
jgi:hypothetical protein